MTKWLPTVIWRHQRENLKKCSLQGLESRDDFAFYTYPKDHLGDLSSYILLSLDGEELSETDGNKGLFLIDGTWRYASVMLSQLSRYCPSPPTIKRSLPHHFVTAYPRKQKDCNDPERGLASVEALYVAYRLMGRDTSGLLDHYYWKERFLELNALV